jgi:hypothetical protein
LYNAQDALDILTDAGVEVVSSGVILLVLHLVLLIQFKQVKNFLDALRQYPKFPQKLYLCPVWHLNIESL